MPTPDPLSKWCKKLILGEKSGDTEDAERYDSKLNEDCEGYCVNQPYTPNLEERRFSGPLKRA